MNFAMNRTITHFVLLVGFLTPVINAQSTDTAATVVTVTARPTPVSQVSAAMTVLDREYIENSHADTAADLLRATPFLTFAQTGAPGGLTTISIRGGKSNFTLVMIDGVPVNDITNLLGGSFDLSSLPIGNIERVEIVRGPLSSVYGSDAIGGVINFISRKGSKNPTLDIAAEAGSFYRRQFQIDTSGTWKALQIFRGRHSPQCWKPGGERCLFDRVAGVQRRADAGPNSHSRVWSAMAGRT